MDYVCILERHRNDQCALSQEADIAKVQESLGYANVSTTRFYDRRKTRSEDSPKFRIRY